MLLRQVLLESETIRVTGVYLKFPPPPFGCLSVWERPESDLTPPVSNGVFGRCNRQYRR
jgi:hypothetical protein